MATSTITNTITDATGTPLPGVTVIARIRPGAGFRTATGSEIVDVTTVTNGSGIWTLALERTAGVSPSNSYYEIEEQIPAANGGPRTWAITVGSINGTLYANLLSLLVAAPSQPTAITTASGDARYVLHSTLAFNVKDYGALGDGVTDDSTAIQAALAAVAATGGHVFFPQGTYLIGTTLSVPANTTLSGVGDASAIKAKATLTGSIFANASSGGTITVSDLLIDGNSLTIKGIYWTNGARFIVTRCRFYRFLDNPIRFTTLNYATVSDCQFTTCNSVAAVSSNFCVFVGCTFQEAWITIGTGGSIGATPSTRCAIIGCTFDGTTNPTDDHIYIDLNSSDNIVANNVSRNGQRYGIIVDQSPRNLIANNVIVSPGGYGILITNNTADGQSSRNQVIGNHVRNAGADGILAQGGSAIAPITGVLIADNIVEVSAGCGINGNCLAHSTIRGNIVELSQQHGIIVQNSSYCRVDSNDIKDSSQETTDTYRQVHLIAVDHTLIANNTTAETAANKAHAGIEEVGASDSNLIDGNYLTGMLGAGVVRLGTATKIRNNVGYNPVGSVTAPTFPATTVAATNTTGVDVTAFVTNGASAITQITVGGTNTGMNIDASKWATIRIPAGQTIAFTYGGGSPSWSWMGD